MQTTTDAKPDEAKFSHRHIDVGDVRLHVVEAGHAPFARRATSRPLVILLHGFPEFWWSWRYQLEALAEAGFHVVAPDMRGYNFSDKPGKVEDYRIEALAADVAGLVRALGKQRAVVVGHDWGGAAAWQFAMSHPQSLERLVILNSPHPLRMKAALGTLRQLKKSWYMLFFQLPRLPEKFLAKDDYAAIRRTFARDGVPKPDIDRYVEAFAREGTARAAVNYYRSALGRILRGDSSPIAAIDAPTLVLWGDRDHYMGNDLATPSRTLVPNARVEFISGASHWVQHNAPARVNELLIEFIADLRSGRPS